VAAHPAILFTDKASGKDVARPQLDARRGAYRGRKKALSGEQRAEARGRVAAGEGKAAMARAYGISREILYQYLRAAE